MKYWFDIEFHDDGDHVALISIGVVAEDGRQYYAASADYDRGLADRWLQDHVLPLLDGVPLKTREALREELLAFFQVGGMPSAFWADVGEYDWVVLRQLFGPITTWPDGWPHLCMDVEQWRQTLGAPASPFPMTSLVPHDALQDVIAMRERWRWLCTQPSRVPPC